MKNYSPSLLALSLFFFCSAPLLEAEIETEASSIPSQAKTQPISPTDAAKAEARTVPPAIVSKFQPFTGKIIKNKVRLRLQSAYDAPVIRELNHRDLVVVLGETEDFYAIQPPDDFRAYVFRTYVLDNVIEGSHVNVRLKPELDAPVVVQLNSGDRVEGSVNPANNKWLEIKLPPTVRFYIAKEYVEKAGDAGLKARLDKKHEEVYQLLHTTEAVSKAEMQKPFGQMNIEGIKANYQHIVFDYPEFPEAGLKAKEALDSLQEAYTNKKLAYLENQSRASSSTLEVNKKLSSEIQAQKNKINQLEQQIEKNRQFSIAAQPIINASSTVNKPVQIPINMSAWIPIEENLFNVWSQQKGNHNPKDFYEEQKQQSFVLRGIVDPYTRPVKNKPGDYLLLSTANKLPIAFLYSTHINLQDYIGHEVSIVVSPRNNNNFAFPAYFVLTLE